MTINVFSTAPWPGNQLSNLAASEFVIDGMTCASAEGFIQALKRRDPDEQRRICGLVGIEAKRAGSGEVHEQVVREGRLWWLGQEIELGSIGHFDLVERALTAKFTQHEASGQALRETSGMTLTHNTGRPESPTTTLRANTFIAMLYRIRATLTGV